MKKELTDEEKEIVQQQMMQAYREIKKKLKPCSKNQLIAIIVDQLNRFNAVRQRNEELLDQVNELKGKLGEEEKDEEVSNKSDNTTEL